MLHSGHPAKFDRCVEHAVFQCHPVRGQLRSAAVSEASVPSYTTAGKCFVRALPARWRSVVAALASAIHGGPGPHITTSSIQQSTLFTSNSICGRHKMDHRDRRCVGTYGSKEKRIARPRRSDRAALGYLRRKQARAEHSVL